MVKQGQIFKEVKSPKYRKPENKPFLISHLWFTSANIIYSNGETARVGLDWLKNDCVLLAEFETWQEAIEHLTDFN